MMLPPADAGILGLRVHRHAPVSFADITPWDRFAMGFDGLAALVQTALSLDPYGGALFIFRGRRGDLIKALHWDGQGLCLYAKRLELPKARFVWPQAGSGTVTLTHAAGLDAHRRDRLAHARLDGPARGRRLAPRHDPARLVPAAQPAQGCTGAAHRLGLPCGPGIPHVRGGGRRTPARAGRGAGAARHGGGRDRAPAGAAGGAAPPALRPVVRAPGRRHRPARAAAGGPGGERGRAPGRDP